MDRDADGYVVCQDCDLPPGKQCGDCDDGDGTVNPGAKELCNGKDDDCDGMTDTRDPDLTDPDPYVVDGPAKDDDGDGDYDEGFGRCVFYEDGPKLECKTGGRLECVWPAGKPSVETELGTLTCVNLTENVIFYSDESFQAGTCDNAADDDCDLLIDVEDPGCQRPEVCDYKDNDGDTLVDEGFPRAAPGSIGKPCTAGVGECARGGFYVCRRDTEDGECNAIPGNPKAEGSAYGDSCANGLDDDCDGTTDLADKDCALYGKPELCGNEVDDNGNGSIDEGFPLLGEPCAEGQGACMAIGALVCSSDRRTLDCNATPGTPVAERESAGNCDDYSDNDCDGLPDHKDPDCPSECGVIDADLGVTCSLPYRRKDKTWSDCKGTHVVQFSAGKATDVKAELLAYDVDGTVLGVIEDVQDGDPAVLLSRAQLVLKSRNALLGGERHRVEAPYPVLRVTGKKGRLTDVAYCSILPQLTVTAPRDVTFALHDDKSVKVTAALPLVDVDSLDIRLDGIDLLSAIGVDPASAFPTTDACLCAAPGDCVLEMPAGCGGDGTVAVEVRNLRVDGLDTNLASDAMEGIAHRNQSNTLSFTLHGLPAGGHKVRIAGSPLPYPAPLNAECAEDDLTDAGKFSAFGIDITTPKEQEVVTSGALFIAGTVCGEKEIKSLSLNGMPVAVGGQVCQAETQFDAAECHLAFNERMPQHTLADAVTVNAPTGSFLRGSNRVIADATDIDGGRTFNAERVFALGEVQKPVGAEVAKLEATLLLTDQALAASPVQGIDSSLLDEVREVAPEQVVRFMDEEIRPTLEATLVGVRQFVEERLREAVASAEVNPGLVAGLDQQAAKDFFAEGCADAIQRFQNDVTANLSGKTFGTIDVQPDCSCDLNNVPLVLESITFVGSNACGLDFRSGEMELSVDFKDIALTIGAHRSCTTRGLFGECLARTRINATVRADIVDIGFSYVITEEQIETREPATDSFAFTWDVKDFNGHPLYSPLGACSGGPDAGASCFSDNFCGPAPGAGHCASGPDEGDVCSNDSSCAMGSKGNRCFGGENQGRSCTGAGDCPGGACFSKCVGNCVGEVKNEDFDPVVSADTPIECWGAWVCSIFDTVVRGIGVGIAEVFTLGFADTSGWIAGQFGIGEFQLEEDFLRDFQLNEPDAMGVGDIGLDPNDFASGGGSGGIQLNTGAIDVEIETPGLTVAIPATFGIACDDPDVGTTPGSAVTSARAPTVAELMAVGGSVSLLLADDFFNQTFSSMVQCGDLKSFCITARGAETLGDVLPDCDSLPLPKPQGICHAIRGADCDSLPGAPGQQGACHGFSGTDCSTLTGLKKSACEETPPRNIRAEDALLMCAKVDMDPEIGISPQAAKDGIGFDLAIKQLNVTFVLDREGNNYADDLIALDGCFSDEGDAAPDCLIYAACLDVALKSNMRLDNSHCSANELGFNLDVETVLPSNEQFGVMCAAPDVSDDLGLLQEAFQGLVIDKIQENAEKLAPSFCAKGLTLEGVMELVFSSTKLFGVVTEGLTPGFADFLGITVDLTP